MITDIQSSHMNHGEQANIIATVTTTHEVEFSTKDILTLLSSCGSDDLAKLVNELGRIFNPQGMTQAYSVNDLNEDGKTFIENMYFFMKKDPLI